MRGAAVERDDAAVTCLILAAHPGSFSSRATEGCGFRFTLKDGRARGSSPTQDLTALKCVPHPVDRQEQRISLREQCPLGIGRSPSTRARSPCAYSEFLELRSMPGLSSAVACRFPPAEFAAVRTPGGPIANRQQISRPSFLLVEIS